MVQQAFERAGPVVPARGTVAAAGREHRGVHPDGRGDHRYAARHVGQKLEAAFTPRPGRVRERHYSDGHLLDCADFGLWRPGDELDPVLAYALETRPSIGDDAEG